MKYALIVLILSCLTERTNALKTASKEDHAEIQKVLERSIGNEEDIAINIKTQKIARAEEIKPLKDDLIRLQNERAAAYERALWLTIKAYDILPFTKNQPILPTGVSVHRSPENGKTITWVPIFEDNGPKIIQNEVGRIVARPSSLDPDVVGNTASDGVSRILPGSFMSPEELASIVIHEKVHFEQFITPGKGDVKTAGELEVEAYGKEQELLDSGVLGFSDDMKRRQQARLAEMHAKKKKQAAAERAKIIKAKGLPLDNFSIASHSDDDLKKLVSQAREQVKIAYRDHDDRLRGTLLDLTYMSCANPGSVTQAMLDILPQAHDEDFWASKTPENCYSAYHYMALGGRNAKSLGSLSTPAAPARPNPPPRQAVQPLPRKPEAARPLPQTPFSSLLPGTKDLAVMACHSPGQVTIESFLALPFYSIRYSRASDDQVADSLSAGLSDCERQMFRRLIEVLRSGRGDRITAEWVQNTVAEYRNSGTTPGYSTPPSGGDSPRQSPDHNPVRRRVDKVIRLR